MNDYNKSTAPTWTNFLAETWSKYKPPIRPYEKELQVFERLLLENINTNNSDPKVLILGSTPELRSLCTKHGIAPYVIDYSLENFTAMGSLIKVKGDETFINQNWLDMDIGITFDVILSEAAFNVINSSMTRRFLQRLQNHLKPTGVLLAKTWVRRAKLFSDIDELVDYFYLNMQNKDFYSAMCLPLMIQFYNLKEEKIAVKELSLQINKLFSNGKIRAEDWETIERHHYEKADLELYIPDLKDIKEIIGNYFIINEQIELHFDFSSLHPIFVCSYLNNNNQEDNNDH